MSNCVISLSTAASLPSPLFDYSTPCLADLVCDLPSSVLRESCLPAVQSLVENHPINRNAPDNCLRACSKFLRTDLDSITHINSLLPRGWSLMAAPSHASVVHRRREEKRRTQSINAQCKALLLKVQQRFMNKDGSNGTVTMLFLHLLNNRSDRSELRRSVRALFQWHPDLCCDFDDIFCPSNIIPDDDGLARTAGRRSSFDLLVRDKSTQETPRMYRTPSPAPSLTLSAEGTFASSSVSPSSHRASTLSPVCFPGTISHVRRKVDHVDIDSPNESWMSSFIFTPRDSSPSAWEPELVGHDASVHEIDVASTPTPTTARSLMDRHLSRTPLQCMPSPTHRTFGVANPAPTVSSPPKDVLCYLSSQSASLRNYSEYDPTILPSYASLDKDICTDGSSPSLLLSEDSTAKNSSNSLYEPVLFPFDVTHGRVVQFETGSQEMLLVAKAEKKMKKIKGRGVGVEKEGRRARSVRSARGVEAWVDVTIPRAAATEWKSSSCGAVGGRRQKKAVGRAI